MMIRPNDLVFDVGASKGDMTARYREAGARVVCFEPEPVSLAKLNSRFANDPNVFIVPMGLAAKPGTLRLEVCSRARTISTFSDHWKTGRFAKYHWDHGLEVPVTTLDDAISEYGLPQFIKIDVEGYEPQVVKGLSQKVPFLSFEFAREFFPDAVECLDRLMRLGFYEFAVKLGTAAEFAVPWSGWDEVVRFLESQPRVAWGDIYAKSIPKESKPNEH